MTTPVAMLSTKIIPKSQYRLEKPVPKAPIVPQGPDAWKSDEVLSRFVKEYDGLEPVDFEKGDVVYGIKIGSVHDKENMKFAIKLLYSDMDEKVIFKEIGTRGWKQIEAEGKLDCKKIRYHVLGIYNKLSEITGMGYGIEDKNVCGYCDCPLSPIFIG